MPSEIELVEGVLATAEGLAVFPNHTLAAASDLHIGFEEALGENLARVQTRLLLDRFGDVISRFNLDNVLLNGDLKHTFGKKSAQEWNEIQFFIAEMRKRAEVIIVKGNHDFYIENMVRDFNLRVYKEYSLPGLIFAHGDEDIDNGNSLLVLGNEHPSITLRDDIGASRKYPCFLYCEKEKVLVLPAVNPWAPGTDILSVNPKHFLSPSLRRVNLQAARVFAFDGEEIYDFKTVADIRKMILKGATDASYTFRKRGQTEQGT